LGWFRLPCCSNPLSPGPQDYRELFEAVQPGSDKTLEDKFYEKEVCGRVPPPPPVLSLSDSAKTRKESKYRDAVFGGSNSIRLLCCCSFLSYY
jgi:hypothetical protein